MRRLSAYVYLVYFYDPGETDYGERLRQVQPIVCASMRRVEAFLKNHSVIHLMQPINAGTLWRAGNYWVERCPIIDSYDEGLECEVRENFEKVASGRIPLVFEVSE